MTAKIYDFQAAAKTRKQVSKKKPQRELTPSELFDEVLSDVIDDWQQAAKNNKLNELIGGKLPPHIRGPDNTDYVNDLNAISRIEQKLNLTLSINSPTFSGNKVGWLVIFKKDNEVYSGSSDMILESYARAFNVLLAVTFDYRLKLSST